MASIISEEHSSGVLPNKGVYGTAESGGFLCLLIEASVNKSAANEASDWMLLVFALGFMLLLLYSAMFEAHVIDSTSASASLCCCFPNSFSLFAFLCLAFSYAAVSTLTVAPISTHSMCTIGSWLSV